MDLTTRQLSDRERTVLLLAADGLTDKEIAQKLSLSQRTIGTYWERMREKLGHFSRTQLVASFLTSTGKVEESDKYRSLFSGWQEGIWIVLNDGTTIYSNYRIAELFNLTPEGFQGANARELIQQVTSISFDKLLERARSEDPKIEFSIRRDDHSVVWMSMTLTSVSNGQGREGALILRLNDITVGRRVKSTLDSCERSLLFLSDCSSDFIARFDSNLCCRYANPAFKAFLNRSIEGEKILDLPELFRPNAGWVTNLVEALSSGETQQFVNEFAGLEFGSETHLLPVPGEDGKSLEVISISTVRLN